MREAIKLGTFLLVVCAVIGLGTAYTNTLTDPIIKESERVAQEQGLKEVYADADEIKDQTEEYGDTLGNSTIKEVNIAYKGGQQVGVVYKVEPSGYSSNLVTLVGFDIATKEITKIKILSQAETPGLGALAVEAWYTDRYMGKSAAEDLVVVKNPPTAENQIESITASTITSKAVTLGVNDARKHFVENFQ